MRNAKSKVLDYFSKLTHKPSEGLIEIAGEPQLILSLRALIGMQDELVKRFGRAAAEMALYRLGYEMGFHGGRFIAQVYGIQDPMEKMLTGILTFMRMGWMPYIDILKANLVQDESYFILWETKSNIAKYYLNLSGKTDQVVCFALAGYGAGLSSEAFNLPLATKEITCMAKGDDSCRFLTAHQKRLFELSREEWVRAPTDSFEVTRLKFEEQ